MTTMWKVISKKSALALIWLLFAAGEARADQGVGAGGARWLGPKPKGVPKRIVSLAPSLTETVIALGHAKKLVGVTQYDDAPEVAQLPRVGGFLDPNPEILLGLKPDAALWLADGGAYPAVKQISDLGIPVLALPVVNVADVLATMRLVGSVLDDSAGAEALARRLESSIASVRLEAEGLRKVRVLILLGRDPLIVAGPPSYPSEILGMAGGVNVVGGDRPWVAYSMEKAVSDDPDLVIDASMNEPESSMARLSTIPAVRRGAVYRPRNDDLLRPGPRLARALPAVFLAIHPESPAR